MLEACCANRAAGAPSEVLSGPPAGTHQFSFYLNLGCLGLGRYFLNKMKEKEKITLHTLTLTFHVTHNSAREDGE